MPLILAGSNLLSFPVTAEEVSIFLEQSSEEAFMAFDVYYDRVQLFKKKSE